MSCRVWLLATDTLRKHYTAEDNQLRVRWRRHGSRARKGASTDCRERETISSGHGQTLFSGRYLQNGRAAVIANRTHWVNTSPSTHCRTGVKKAEKSITSKWRSPVFAVASRLFLLMMVTSRKGERHGWPDWCRQTRDACKDTTAGGTTCCWRKGRAACRATPSQHSPNSGLSNLWIMD